MATSYDAFISYSHAADGKLAPALQNALQRFAKPWYRRRALNLFRDQTSLSASPGLWPSIEAALQSSRYFLLLASPRAAASRWVQQEVAWWLEHKSPETLLIGLTDGHIKRPEGAKDFDWEQTDALPPNLKGVFTENPLWVDFRWAKGEEQLSTKNPEFQGALAALAAPLRNIPKEDLIGEDIRQHRRTKQWAWGVGVVLFMLLILAGWQWRVAEHEAQVALSRQLAAQSSGLGANQRDLALLLGVEAWRAADTVEARSSLLSAVLASRHLTRYLRGQPENLTAVAFSPDGQTLASVDYVGNLVFWDVPSGRMLAEAGGTASDQLDFSPNGKTLIAASWNNAVIRLWDARTGTLLQELADPAVLAAQQEPNPVWGPINGFALSPDGSTVAAPGPGGAIVLWDIATGRPRITRQAFDRALPDRDVSFAFSPDGRRVAAARCTEAATMAGCEVGKIRVWDLADDRLLAEPLVLASTPRVMIDMRFSPNSRRLAATGCTEQDEDGICTEREIRVWNLQDDKTWAQPLVLDDAGGNFQYVVVFSPDGGTLVLGSDQGTVIVWDITSGEPERKRIRNMDSPIRSAAFSSDGQVLAVGDEDGKVALWDVQTGWWRPGAMDAHGGQVLALAFGPDDRTLASGGTDRTVVLLDTLAAEPLARAPTGLPSAWDMAMSPDGTKLAAALGEQGVVLLSETTGERLGELAGAPSYATTVAFSPDGSTVVAGGADGAIVIWDVDVEQPRGGPLEGPPGGVAELAFSPDGAKLAAGGAIDATESVVTIWETATMRPLSDLGTSAEPLPGEVTGVEFSPDSSKLAAGSSFGTVVIWEVSSGKRANTPLSDDELDVQGVTFSPDGRTLAASTSKGEVFLWDAASFQPRGTPLTSSPIAFEFAFSPDGNTLAVADVVGAQLWDVATGQTIGAPLDNPAPSVARTIAFRPDGLAIAVAGSVAPGSPDSGVIIWDLDVDSWVAVACARAGRNLTSDEWRRYLRGEPQRDTCPTSFDDSKDIVSATPRVTEAGTTPPPVQASPALDFGSLGARDSSVPHAAFLLPRSDWLYVSTEIPRRTKNSGT